MGEAVNIWSIEILSKYLYTPTPPHKQMHSYKNHNEFVRQVVHPFANNLKLLIKDSINLIYATKNEILDIINKLTIKHDKDIADLNDRCDDIEDGYKQGDNNLHDRINNLEQDVDDQLSNMREEVTTIVGNSGTSIYTTSGTYTAIRTGPHFCILVGGGGGSFGMPYYNLYALGGAGGINAPNYNVQRGYDSLICFKVVNLIKNARYDVVVGTGGIGYSSDDVESAFGILNTLVYTGNWAGFSNAVQIRYDYYYNSNTGGYTTFAGMQGYGGLGGCYAVVDSIADILNNYDRTSSLMSRYPINKRYPITYGYTKEILHNSTEAHYRFLMDTYGIGGYIQLEHSSNYVPGALNKSKKANGTSGICIIF